MDIEGKMPDSSRRRPDSRDSLMVDRVCLLLPLFVSLLSLVVQIVMHSVFWNIRSVRDSAFPLFLLSALLFPFVAVSSWRSATSGGSWVIGSVGSIVFGLAILGCTLIYVFICWFAMK